MRSASFRLFGGVFFALAVSVPIPGFAVEDSAPALGVNELSGIKTRLAVVEKTQLEILAQKDKILEELNRIRVWVRHSGGNPKK